MIKHLGTEEIALEELSPFPGNAKRGDVEAIRESLRLNGQYRSLIVRRSELGLTVLAGNHTLQAMAAEGYGKALCQLVSCDDLTARRVNLADNRTSDLGTYDDDALAVLLTALDADNSLAGTGYTLDDLESLLPALEMAEQPSGARYAETDEELAARREKIADYQPRHDSSPGDGAFTELILVLTVADRTEAVALVGRIRQEGGDDRTAGQIVLSALRAYAAGPQEDNDE